MLSGKTVFVSGGTGFIGEEICRRAAAYGAKVIFSYHSNEKRARELERDISGSACLRMDMRSVADINSKIADVYKEHPVIDILVNNAGISHVLPLSMLEEEDVDLVMDINVKGTLFVTRAVVRGMIRRKKGSIVNMGSIAGHRLLEVPVTYAMSKAAVAGFTRALAMELRKFNIRVNNIVPGMLEGGVAGKVPDDEREDYIKHCAAGRAGTAGDIAEVVCFVASDRAAYINGQDVSVDGGI